MKISKEEMIKFKVFLRTHPEVAHDLATSNLAVFMAFYLSHLFQHRPGIMQLFMMRDTEELEPRHLLAPTYPESYGEEIFLYANVLWSVLGRRKFTNCTIVCGTREKAREVYEKLLKELLENKEIAKFNHGVTKATCDGWNIYLPGRNARISVLSFPIIPYRIRHRRRSPELLICTGFENIPADTREIIKWLEKNVYSKDVYYEKTILYGGAYDLFEKIKDDLHSKWWKGHRPSLEAYPLFSEDGSCFWDTRFSEEEIEKLWEGFDDPKWQKKYLLHTIHRHKVPKKYFAEDGTCDAKAYLNDLTQEKDHENFFERILLEVDLEHPADTITILAGHYTYYGIGRVAVFEPIED